MEDTWTSRDLPILEAIVQLYELTGRPMTVSEVSQHTGFSDETIHAALKALDGEEPPFFAKLQTRASGHISLIGAPTGHARRAVGSWPTAEAVADRLVNALAEAADREPDHERKGWLSKSAAYLGNAGRDLAVEIGATAINRQMGM
jgi:hypothetical protein